jgi:thiamine biosynthesis lipoprotein
MAMGTRCDVVLIHDDTGFAERVFQVLQKETVQLEHLLSRFQQGAPIAVFNAMGPEEPFHPGNELWSMILKCREFAEWTGGMMDITAGPMVRILKGQGDAEKAGTISLEKEGAVTGFHNIRFDLENHILWKNIPGVELDFGAVGKGFALDKMKSVLETSGIVSAFVSFGESSLMGLGKHPAGEYWPVGITDPVAPEDVLHTFRVKNRFVTSAGTIRKDAGSGEKLRRHIINPVTGEPLTKPCQVSVMTDTAVLGEVLSTAALLLPESGIKELVDRYSDAEFFGLEYEEGFVNRKEYFINVVS